MRRERYWSKLVAPGPYSLELQYFYFSPLITYILYHTIMETSSRMEKVMI